LADECSFILIFDEVKTGFRHGLGGYAMISGVTPDLIVFGKAMANGYPIAALRGRKDLMNCFVHPDPAKRVLLARTYNAHPVPTAASIATIERLLMNDGEGYRHVESLGQTMQEGLEKILRTLDFPAVVARRGFAFCIYFMDHCPKDWHDLLAHHDFRFYENLRRKVIELGIYIFNLATKQCSISFSHTREDIDATLEQVKSALELIAR